MTLEEEYQKTIDDQRSHLSSLQEQFNAECEVAKAHARTRLAEIPETAKEMRQEVYNEEKAKLQEALRKLKEAVSTSTRTTMKKLEDIQRRREEKILEHLEKRLQEIA